MLSFLVKKFCWSTFSFLKKSFLKKILWGAWNILEKAKPLDAPLWLQLYINSYLPYLSASFLLSTNPIYSWDLRADPPETSMNTNMPHCDHLMGTELLIYFPTLKIHAVAPEFLLSPLLHAICKARSYVQVSQPQILWSTGMPPGLWCFPVTAIITVSQRRALSKCSTCPLASGNFCQFPLPFSLISMTDFHLSSSAELTRLLSGQTHAHRPTFPEIRGHSKCRILRCDVWREELV